MAIFNAALAQGRPMIVTAMITAATSQPNAIQAPPNRIQNRLRRMETGGMRFPASGPAPSYKHPAASAVGPCGVLSQDAERETQATAAVFRPALPSRCLTSAAGFGALNR